MTLKENSFLSSHQNLVNCRLIELCEIQNSNLKSLEMFNSACLNLPIWGILKSVLKFKTIHSVGYCGENNAILINSSYYTELKFYQEKRKV